MTQMAQRDKRSPDCRVLHGLKETANGLGGCPCPIMQCKCSDSVTLQNNMPMQGVRQCFNVTIAFVIEGNIFHKCWPYFCTMHIPTSRRCRDAGWQMPARANASLISARVSSLSLPFRIEIAIDSLHLIRQCTPPPFPFPLVLATAVVAISVPVIALKLLPTQRINRQVH